MVSLTETIGSQTYTYSYTYNAWDQLLFVVGSNSTLANRNPIRYCGYMYDSETSLYYLQSRYYNPAIGRFAIAAPLLGCFVGAAIGATFSAMTAVATGGDVGAAIVVGAINGAICAVPFPPSTMTFTVGVSLVKASAAMLADFSGQMTTGSENVDFGGIMSTGAATFVGSMIGAALPR